METTINKGGSTIISVDIRRTGLRPIDSGRIVNDIGLRNGSFGLTVTVRAAAGVEEYIKSMGSGETQDVKTIGRYWVPMKKDEVLQAYHLGGPMGMVQGKNGYFRLDKVANVLQEKQIVSQMTGAVKEVMNLSFLRLVGISEQEGVTFGVKGVYSEEAIYSIQKHTKDALHDFYQTYMKPMSLSVMMVTQEA